MQRRTFLKSFSALPVVAFLPNILSAQPAPEQKLLILVQLGGGNDSLNTFVPYANSAYYTARPELAITADQVLPLSSNLGLNPAMNNLLEPWNNGEMAIIQGLGYENPNRSHFRSIEIWQTASDADQYEQLGWLNHLLPESDFPLQGIVISGSPVALQGEANQFSLTSADNNNKIIPIHAGSASTSAVQHIMDQRQTYNSAIELLNIGFTEPLPLSTDFANDSFSQDCKLVAQTMAAGIRPHVIHLSLGSFDHHSNQRTAHDNLLNQLAIGLSALRAELIALGLWEQVTIASYSEFGRRVAENGSQGTDHGTAASHFVMGGMVNGGIHGVAPSLTDLDQGDLRFSADFRDYYRTLADWMQWQPSATLGQFTNMGFLAFS